MRTCEFNSFGLGLVVLCICCASPGEREVDQLRASSIAHVAFERLADDGDNELSRRAIREIPTITQVSVDSAEIGYVLLLNTCGKYNGTVQVERDSLFLHVIDISEYSCTSESVYEIRFSVHKAVIMGTKGIGWRRHWTRT